MLPHCASSAVPSSTPTWCPQHVLYPQQHFVQRCRPTPAATHPLTTPKVCCECIAALSLSTTCRCCCSYCNPLQSLHVSVLPYAALRPTPYALRPTACVTLRCTLLNLVIFHTSSGPGPASTAAAPMACPSVRGLGHLHTVSLPTTFLGLVWPVARSMFWYTHSCMLVRALNEVQAGCCSGPRR